MPTLANYIIKLSVSLAAVYLIYQLVLRPLTFHVWNRWYLLGYTMIAFLIPFIDISPVIEQQTWVRKTVIQWIPLIDNGDSYSTVAAPGFLTSGNIACIVFSMGVIVMLARLIIQFISFRRMMKKARYITGNETRVYGVDANIIPFSFGNSIFINPALHQPGELKEIIRHEFVHVKQMHSFDIIWGEILCLLNWYNPFAWLLKKAIRQNLEFIADHEVLESGIEKKQYQYLLLKVMGNSQFSIATQFNFSSLKKRIAMMNKLKSAKVHLVKFLFILPVLAIILLSFRKQLLAQVKGNMRSQHPIAIVDTLPQPKKLPSNVKNINIDNERATVTLKDGTREEYDLSKEDQKDNFENKYGELPPPPPVPPVPPVAPVAPVIAPLPPADPPTPPMGPKAASMPIPPPPPPVPVVPPLPPVLSDTGHDEIVCTVKTDCQLRKQTKEWDITTTKAVLKMNDGTTEVYDLTNKAEKQKFEDKYGKIVPATGKAPRGLTPVAYVEGSEGNLIAGRAPRAGEPVIGDTYSYRITGNEDVLITITKNTTKDQLEDFKKQMKDKGVELSFDNIDYNNGVLVSISGTMKCKESHSNFVATDFTKLILAMIKKGERTYFKVSVRDSKSTDI